MKFKFLNATLMILALSFCSLANAAIIDIEYSFDGTNMSLTSGPDLFTQNIAVGDVLTLTYTAEGENSYWDFSNVERVFGGNLGFLADSSAIRTSKGSYEASLDGESIFGGAYISGPQDEFHLGPNFINYSFVDTLDSFTISYEMLSTTNVLNNIGSFNGEVNDFQVWDLFGLQVHGASFVFVEEQSSDIPEPSTLAIFALGMIGLASRRFKKKS